MVLTQVEGSLAMETEQGAGKCVPICSIRCPVYQHHRDYPGGSDIKGCPASVLGECSAADALMTDPTAHPCVDVTEAF